MYHFALVSSVGVSPLGLTRSIDGTAVVKPKSELEKLHSSLG